jgi:hypothetical protein
MSSEGDIQSYLVHDEILVHGGPSHFEMNEAFCARMRAAIAAGLESALIGVVTTPGTKNPKYVANQTARYLRSRDE